MLANNSQQKVNQDIIDEIRRALESVKSFGSVEIYIQDNIVTQITTRTIKKTHNSITNLKKKFKTK